MIIFKNSKLQINNKIMNIFAKIITTTDENIKNEIIKVLNLKLKEKKDNIEVYSKLWEEVNIVLIYSKNNFEETISYAKNNYEIINIINIWTSFPLDTLDINPWDVIIPNTFINKKNEAIFLDYLIEKNYDLKKFWLILNWICLTLEDDIKNEDELSKIVKKFSAWIFDKEAYKIAKNFEKNELLKISCIIKIVGKDLEYIRNWIQILELML